MKQLKNLSEKEILALAISNEEEDSKIYSTLSLRFLHINTQISDIFKSMAIEEQDHKNQLIELYKKKFGTEIPYISRKHILGSIKLKAIWLQDNISVKEAREHAKLMEHIAWHFYLSASKLVTDADTRKLLGDLAIIEQNHQTLAAGHPNKSENIKYKALLLQIIQPGLSGLIDGSISTLAPIFASAFATQNTHSTLLVGLAASLGNGISMGITEGMSDDGEITGRGHPWIRGSVCGIMTTIGGLGHTIPFFINDFKIAFIFSILSVLFELIFISWIRWRYMESSFISSMVQVFFGGILVLLIGIIIGTI